MRQGRSPANERRLAAPREPLPRSFYERDTLAVARALLGQRLVRVLDGGAACGSALLSGIVYEAEAYGGPDDEASHAHRRTPRSAIMYGPPGIAYVYFIYGAHYCLNAVTEAEGTPGAVLIRGILPVEGLDIMRQRRGTPATPAGDARLADGPGKLCQALGITGALNGLDLAWGETLYFAAGETPPEHEVVATPRIGVRGNAEALSRAWRFVWRVG
jgi:DNA-3-methyladenine glycosylase